MRAALVLAMILLAGCSRQSATPPAASQQPTTSGPAIVEVVKVVEQKLARTVRLPGELLAYQSVAIYPKITSFVERINVDRGSRVRRGQMLARMTAPELTSQRSEEESRLQAVRAQRTEAEAKLAADETYYQRLRAASETPGVVAGNDVVMAQKAVEAGRARVQALQSSEKAARAALQSGQQMEAYLSITAPFDGVITERNVHPGTLASATGPAPMLRLEQVSRLRLVVAVPEVDVAGIAAGERVSFTVPAFPGETFHGTIRRVAHSLDPKTRTMAVEMDVSNPTGRLSPGMFPEVSWPVRRPKPTLFVPLSAIATTTERTFVIRIRDGRTEWVDVRRGSSAGELVEIFGDLRAGDEVARRGTDELRPGTVVTGRG